MIEAQGDWKVYTGEDTEKGVQRAVVIAKGLNEEQKDFVLKNWDKMDLLSLTRQIFGDQTLENRSSECKLVKKFLAERKVKKKSDPKSSEVILTDEQKEYVQTSIDTLTPHEIGKILFDDSKIAPTSKEVLAISAFANTLENPKQQFPHEDYAQEDYRPPDQISAIVSKVNQFLRKEINHKTMPTIQRKTMEALRGFLNAPRFLQTINSYVSQKNRDMFEAEFVRSVFDKPDLTPDEINIVVTMCQLYIQQITLHKHADLLNVKYEEALNEPKATGLQALAEMVKAKATELKECNKAIADSVKSLSGERSKRQEKQTGNGNSIARLVEWFQDDNERKKALKRAELQAQEDEEEVNRLESISEMKARILGISRSELLNG